MAAEILSATMVVSLGPLRKKGMLNQWTSMTPRGGLSGVVNKVIYTAAHSKPSIPQPSRTVLKEKVLFRTPFLEKLSSFHKPTSLLFPNPWNEEIAKKNLLVFFMSRLIN